MKLIIDHGDILSYKADALLLGMFKEHELAGDLAKINDALNGALKKALDDKDFSADTKETLSLTTQGSLPYKRILILGLGKIDEFKEDHLRRACGFGAKALRSVGMKTIASRLHANLPKDHFDQGKVSAEGFALGLYQFLHHKTRDTDKIKVLDTVTILGTDKTDAEALRKGATEGELLANATNYVRNLVNEPANIITPTRLAAEAKRIAKEHKLKLTVLEEKDMAKLGMHSLLAVTKGSNEPAKFIILEYGKGDKSIAFAGKGITFDSGGLSLKPSPYMEDMKIDMGGAAAVLGTMKAIASLKLPVKAYGVIATCENMPSGHAIRPGDIVKAMNGKTIEILNTDAEGRLILADALSFIEAKIKPRYVIDLATLTGACVVALGHEATAVLGHDDAFIQKLLDAGQDSFERTWRLPLWEEYKERMKSDIADVRNINVVRGGEAGTITAAVFLNHFIEKTTWAHLDIAGTAYITEEKDYLPKGATGMGPRLLVELVKRL